MSTEESVTIVRRLIEEGFSRGDLDVCDALVAADGVEHQRGLAAGPAGTKEAIATLHRWFDDFRLEVEDVIAEGDRVWVRSTASGTNTGSVLGRPPTGRTFRITVFDAVRVVDGRIAEHWGVPDQLGLLVQLGIFAPGAS
ncbi:MAG: ester cyclase [Chloroflexota bacterium]